MHVHKKEGKEIRDGRKKNLNVLKVKQRQKEGNENRDRAGREVVNKWREGKEKW